MTHALSAGLPNLVDESLEEASELENDTASTTSETAKQDDLRAAEFKRTHRQLCSLIGKTRKQYHKKRTQLTDDNAASRLIDLEALDQYNNLRLRLQLECLSLKLRYKMARGVMRHQLKLRMSQIKPAINASTTVAGRCNRGPSFARTIRSMAAHLLTTNQLPENNQGKGASHKTLLTDPRVASALQEWVKGGLPVTDGGFEGRVCKDIFLLRCYSDNLLRCVQLNFDDMLISSCFQCSEFRMKSQNLLQFDGLRSLALVYLVSRKVFMLMAMNELM
jgi:hypothetical protein